MALAFGLFFVRYSEGLNLSEVNSTPRFTNPAKFVSNFLLGDWGCGAAGWRDGSYESGSYIFHTFEEPNSNEATKRDLLSTRSASRRR